MKKIIFFISLCFVLFGCKSDSFYIDDVVDQRCVVKCDSCKNVEKKRLNLENKLSNLDAFITSYSNVESELLSLKDSLSIYKKKDSYYTFAWNNTKKIGYLSTKNKSFILNDFQIKNLVSLVKKIDSTKYKDDSSHKIEGDVLFIWDGQRVSRVLNLNDKESKNFLEFVELLK